MRELREWHLSPRSPGLNLSMVRSDISRTTTEKEMALTKKENTSEFDDRIQWLGILESRLSIKPVDDTQPSKARLLSQVS
jgi:hypothetical protein